MPPAGATRPNLKSRRFKWRRYYDFPGEHRKKRVMKVVTEKKKGPKTRAPLQSLNIQVHKLPKRMSPRKMEAVKDQIQQATTSMLTRSRSALILPPPVGTSSPRKRGRPLKKQDPNKENEVAKRPANNNKTDNDFDLLVSQKNNLRSNIRTYARKKTIDCEPPQRPQFTDPENRERILAWLNDTRNTFTCLTQSQQSQTKSQNDNSLGPLRSISQVPPNDPNKSRQPPWPYDLRNRSFQPQNRKRTGAKNAKAINRTRSLSLFGSSHGEGRIEQTTSDDECYHGPVDENAKLLIEQMEDDFLESIEKEVLHTKRDRDQSEAGWDRIQESSQQSSLPVQVFDLNVVENFMVTNMTALVENGCGDDDNQILSQCCRPHRNDAIKQALQYGRLFLNSTRMAMNSNCNNCDNDLQTLNKILDELMLICRNEPTKAHQSIQTDSRVMEEKSNLTQATQTSSISFVDKIVQTDEVFEQETGLVSTQKLPETDDARSCFSQILEDLQCNVEEPEVEEITKVPESQPNESQNVELVDDPSLIINSQNELLEEVANQSAVSAVRGQSSLVISRESVTVIEPPSSGDRNVVLSCKRGRESPDILLEVSVKRPCNLINDDLTVDFETCDHSQDALNLNAGADRQQSLVQEEVIDLSKSYQASVEIVEAVPEPDVEVAVLSNGVPNYQFSEENDHLYAECLDQVSEKLQAPPQPTTIKELTEPVASTSAGPKSNTTHPQNHIAVQPDLPTSDNIFADEENIDKILGHIDIKPKFDSKSSPQNPVEDDTCKQKRPQWSEKIETQARDITFNTENVDKILNNINRCPEKIPGQCDRVRVLQNVTIQPPDPHDSDEDIIEGSQPDDVCCNINSIPRSKSSSTLAQENRAVSKDVSQVELDDSENDVTLVKDRSCLIFSPTNRESRVATIYKKFTSTPRSNKPLSEQISLSPVAGKVVEIKGNSCRKDTSRRSDKGSRCTTPSPVGRQRSILTYMRESQESSRASVAGSQSATKPCIACTRLNRDQIIQISSLSNKKLATYSGMFTPKVTHMIVAVNENNEVLNHTIKYAAAIAAGIWVLNFGWVLECLAANKIVPEEPHEVLDITAVAGPKRSRLLRTLNPLLRGFRIYVAPPFQTTSQEEIENMVRMCGGKVERHPENLFDKNGNYCLIITDSKSTQNFDMYEDWLEALGVASVDIEWLSRSLGQYKLLSIYPFTMCADDYLDKLGYPPELVVKDQLSFLAP